VAEQSKAAVLKAERALQEHWWSGRLVRAGACLVAAAICGCTTLELNFQRLPPSEDLASVQPGVTTRSEVLQRLGPPEEFRRPAAFERARLTSLQRRQTLEAHQIFGRDARRTTRSFGILPAGIVLFRISRVHSAEVRWRIEFDEGDVVTSVSHVDERR
jgi:hypothetical protein